MPREADNQMVEPEEERRIGDFLLGKTIGQGTFNKVKIARHIHSNEQVAIKLIDKQKINSQADRRRLAKELKILRKVRHPNIIQLYEILQDQRYYYVATEYASRGELFEHIVKNEKLTEFQASKILQQMVNAIEYLHQLGVVHRDLKPENILLDYKYNVKIIDFGLSNIYNRGDTLTTACGSPCYAAPEMLSGKSYNPLKIDIWSLGIILYAMCFGFLPFDHSDSAQLYRLIKEGRYELPDHASENLVDMLKIVLEVDPTKRASLDDIRKHEFCRFSPSPHVSGIIQGLSSFPFEDHIERIMKQLKIDINHLKEDIQNNKHNNLTSTYYLLLQQWLRQRSESILSYYISKDNLINRYKLIEKVKENYDKRLIERQEEIAQQRKVKQESGRKKKGKSIDRIMYHTGNGFESHTVNHSKNLFSSPQRKKRKTTNQTSSKRQSNTRKQLKRS